MNNSFQDISLNRMFMKICESNASVVVPDDIVRAPSDPFHHIGARICESAIRLFAKLASLSEMITSSAPTGVVFCVNPWTSTVGVTAIGLPAPSKPITCVVVPVRYVSTPVPSVMIALFAVNHVRVAAFLSSLLVPRFVISLVFVAISDDRASRATLIAPEIDPRVNI